MNGNNNVLRLAGTIKGSELAYTNEESGEKFYRLFLEVERLSDTTDILQLICSEKLLYDVNYEEGTYVTVRGYVRTRAVIDEETGRKRTDVFGYLVDIHESDLVDSKENNIVKITGRVCRPVRTRKTARTSREITDITIAVERPYDKRDYIPCIAWSRNAVLASYREVGDIVSITGRFQSRQFKKRDTDEIIVTYEVSVIDLQVEEEAVQEPVEDNDTVTEAVTAEEETTATASELVAEETEQEAEGHEVPDNE